MSRIDSGAITEGAADSGQTFGQVKDKVAEVGQNVREIGSQVRDAARQQYDHLRDQAGDYYENSRQKAEEWEKSLEQYVQEKPVQALLIAAGVGLLIGTLWRRS